ncbi:PadR family transcriptional regulator [Spirochaeta isovalerica]|uniref:DNA-binding PadR family transcriptional regulator n=1 Tax=Spirochaeta isovalerica TaxID=150 RepID=A0A841R8M3_9SPIO|nr:PadR family transcriptional regulator [Spirochaeta isovalerica]MBB6479309.1 DNA-binding PadR family transcriptional regulator [Spirochaeta isovalerica]
MSENEKIIDNLLQELKRGTLVLTVLLNTEESCYGYSLVQNLKEKGVEIEQNTLYPLLRRLEKQNLLESIWDTSENRPRKYYRISESGKDVRDSLLKEWQRTNAVIESMLSREDGE